MEWVIGGLAGAALGALVVWLWLRGAPADSVVRAQELEKQLALSRDELSRTSRELTQAVAERAGAEKVAARVAPLESQLAELQKEKERLIAENQRLASERTAAKDQITWLDEAQKKLREAFQSLAADALKGNSKQLTEQARAELEGLLNSARGDLQNSVNPLAIALSNLDKEVKDLESKREKAYGELGQQLKDMLTSQEGLKTAATNLAHAMKSDSARGRWGEVQLKRVVELAGMAEHVDYSTQASTDEGRPDMVVKLPRGGELPVDSKAPMKAFFEAVETADEKHRQTMLALHAQSMRTHIAGLARKDYWKQFESAPEFVVMFVANEACIAAALTSDPAIAEFAIERRILIASPMTLVALLKAVAIGWQQQQVTEHARQIADEARTFYERFGVFLKHYGKLGDALTKAVDAYNDSVGSAERTVLPSLRRLKEMGLASQAVDPPAAIEASTRHVAAPEATP